MTERLCQTLAGEGGGARTLASQPTAAGSLLFYAWSRQAPRHDVGTLLPALPPQSPTLHCARPPDTQCPLPATRRSHVDVLLLARTALGGRMPSTRRRMSLTALAGLHSMSQQDPSSCLPILLPGHINSARLPACSARLRTCMALPRCHASDWPP